MSYMEDSAKWAKIVRKGIADHKARHEGGASAPASHQRKPTERGAWFWYLVIVVMAVAAVYKTVGAP